MILVIAPGTSEAQLEAVLARVKELGFTPHLSRGTERTIVGVVGDDRKADPAAFEAFPGIERVVPVLRPFKMAALEVHPSRSAIPLAAGGPSVGGKSFVVIAGPCAVESQEQVLTTARAVKAAGAGALRGGAFKPRTSPYAFQGLGEEGLRYLAEARAATGLPVVTEVMTPQAVELVAEWADVLQVGARNMQNFNLLQEVGHAKKPVLLKRGLSSTLEEMLMAAEYILASGNPQVILCERGIRTFEPAMRNTLDIAAVALLKEWTHLPVIVDPSHATGKRSLVPAMALAAAAAGADGLMVEVHPHPERARSDGPQSLTLEGFAAMMERLRPVAAAAGRPLS